MAPDSQPEQLDPKVNMMTALQLDSYDFLQFIISIDQELHCAIPEEDYGKVMTLQALTAYLKGKEPGGGSKIGNP
ncbi:MAG: acyl carrier protein [Bacteroidota bacterium]